MMPQCTIRNCEISGKYLDIYHDRHIFKHNKTKKEQIDKTNGQKPNRQWGNKLLFVENLLSFNSLQLIEI